MSGQSFDQGPYVDQHFEIGEKEAGSVRFGGRFENCTFTNKANSWSHSFRNCEFINCTFDFVGNGRGCLINDSRFERCTFNFKRASNYFLRSGVEMVDCVFTGQLRDCNWGQSESARARDDLYPNACSFERCDFSAAKLDDIWFKDPENVSDCIWPAWPVVLLHQGNDQPDDAPNGDLPMEVSWTSIGRTRFDPSFIVTDLEQKMTNPEDFWAVAHTHPCITFPGTDDKPAPDPERTSACLAINRQHRAIRAKYVHSPGFMAQLMSIKSVRRDNDDLVLGIAGKDLVDAGLPEAFDVVLKNCTLAEWRHPDGTRPMEEFSGSWRIMNVVIDHEEDLIIFKGHRKALGTLAMRYARAEWPEVTERSRRQDTGPRSGAPPLSGDGLASRTEGVLKRIIGHLNKR